MKKAKFDKKKCLKCKYHGLGVGYSVKASNGTFKRVFCDYSGITDSTCLKPGPNHTVIDLRGDDYKNYKLFVNEKLQKEVPQLVIGRKRYEER